MMKKIFYLITSLDYGGAEIQVADLANEFCKKGFTVSVISMIDADSDFVNQKIRKEVNVRSLSMKRGVPSLKALIKLINILKIEKPDVLHCHMIHANILGRISKLFKKNIFVISTAHNTFEGGKLMEVMYKLTDFLSNYNTNVSGVATRRYIKEGIFREKNTSLMPNGVNTPIIYSKEDIDEVKKRLNINENDFVWLAVGRLEVAKDYPNLIKAVCLLNESVPKRNFKVLIVGKGSLEDEIKAQIFNHKVQENVQMLGLRKDINLLMQMSNAFVMSSEWEGLPIVLLEAISNKMPCVVTDAGGNREVVINKKNGFVVPIKDPISLSGRINQVMNLSKADLDLMKKASFSLFQEKYEMEKIILKWENIYSKGFEKK